MELDELRVILLSERETGRLTVIPQDLYEKARDQIAALYAEVCAIDDPLSDEARHLIEATQSMRETMQDILSTRSRKILMLAQVQVEGGYVDRNEAKRMQAEEREMFDLITHALDECRRSIIRGEPGTLQLPAEGEAMSCGQVETVTPAAQPAQKKDLAGYEVVRVLADVEPFLGVDGIVYELAKEDIVAMPERNAEVLASRNIVLNMNLVK